MQIRNRHAEKTQPLQAARKQRKQESWVYKLINFKIDYITN